MIFPYRRFTTSTPVPTLGCISHRYKPIIQVGLATAGKRHSLRGLLDTAADDTVFPRSAAEQLGVVLDGLPIHFAAGAGGPQIGYAVASVTILIHDGTQGCTWTALVGFRLDQANVLPLLGQAGFLQFFTAEFQGDTHKVVLTPNSTFPGTMI